MKCMEISVENLYLNLYVDLEQSCLVFIGHVS